MFPAIGERFGAFSQSVGGSPMSVGIVAGVSCVLVSVYFYFKNAHQYWARRGIDGPKPSVPFGNLLTYLTSKDRMATERALYKQFGRVYGFYRGATSVLIIADIEVMRQICIKDFDIFPNHEKNPFLNKYQRSFLFFAQGDQWRKLRALLTPTFTSSKIRRMFKVMDNCCTDLVACFNEQLAAKNRNNDNSGVIDVKKTFSLYTLDAIALCCFALKLERNGSADIETAASRNVLVDQAMRMLKFNLIRVVTMLTVPHSILKRFGFEIIPERSIAEFANKVSRVVAQRAQSGAAHDDYLQLLMGARLSHKLELDEMDSKENHHANLTSDTILADQKQITESAIRSSGATDGAATATTATAEGELVGRKLSDLEVLSNAMFMLMVGLETTGTLLTHCFYTLAFHVDVQQKLYETIKELSVEKGLDYETITSCEYLDSVVCETLRTLPPVPQIDRVATQDYHIEKFNLTIPKGQQLMLATYAIMSDPQYWDEPEKFNPERFMPENRDKIVPGSYCPFGIGPRHCLGMRFSLTEAKLAIARVLLRFKIEPAPGTSYPPQTKYHLFLNMIKKPEVRMVPRPQ